MVDIPWWDSIRQRGQLTVFLGDTVRKQSWTGIIKNSIKEFNTLSSSVTLGVTFALSSDHPEKPENSFGGADVWVEAAEKFDFELSGQTIHAAITPSVKGDTHRVAWDFGRGAMMRKATILMKPQPAVDLHGGRVGDGVLTCFTVHEFIHAVGLDLHTDGGGDVFQQQPDVSADRNPANDRMLVSGGKTLPPIFLKGTTINRIKALWASPSNP